MIDYTKIKVGTKIYLDVGTYRGRLGFVSKVYGLTDYGGSTVFQFRTVFEGDRVCTRCSFDIVAPGRWRLAE